jgi:hypothetical protein
MGICPAIDRPCDDLCKIEHDNAFTRDACMHTLHICKSNQNVKTLARNLTQSVSAIPGRFRLPTPEPSSWFRQQLLRRSPLQVPLKKRGTVSSALVYLHSVCVLHA